MYGIFYLMFATFPRFFGQTYHLKAGISGLAYLGLGVGFFLATIFGAKFADSMYKHVRHVLRYHLHILKRVIPSIFSLQRETMGLRRLRCEYQPCSLGLCSSLLDFFGMDGQQLQRLIGFCQSLARDSLLSE